MDHAYMSACSFLSGYHWRCPLFQQHRSDPTHCRILPRCVQNRIAKIIRCSSVRHTSEQVLPSSIQALILSKIPPELRNVTFPPFLLGFRPFESSSSPPFFFFFPSSPSLSMTKKSESQPKESEIEKPKDDSSPDVFKLLFGRDAPEEVGLGLRGGFNPEVNGTDGSVVGSDKTKKKKNKEKAEKSDLDNGEVELGGDDSNSKKHKKKKRESVEESGIDAEIFEEQKNKRKKKEEEREEEEIGDLKKEKKKKNKKEEKPVLDVGLVEKEKAKEVVERGEAESGDMKKRKKKRKRDELEQEYEARNSGAVVGKEEAERDKRVVGEKRKSVDDPAAMMVSKEGFDDESKLLRTVFVGNLPLKTKKKALLKEFSKFGEIESARIRSVPLVDSKTPRKGAIFKGKINEAVDSVHAYIVFKDEKAAQFSLLHNMAVVEGNHIRVDMACPPRKKLKGDSTPLYDNKRTVFVGNLPFDVKDEELYQLFCGNNQFGSSIEAIRVIRDPNTSLGRGVAYVLCKTRDAANLILKKKHLKLRDRDLRLYHAKADATSSKKRTPEPSSEDPPAKRPAVGLTGSDNKTKSTLSYQGLQASKSNKRKESFRPKTGERAKQGPKTTNVAEVKQRKSKRPAVAARKAKALKVAASPKQMGKKRKPESRTPESLKRNKKARRT